MLAYAGAAFTIPGAFWDFVRRLSEVSMSRSERIGRRGFLSGVGAIATGAMAPRLFAAGRVPAVRTQDKSGSATLRLGAEPHVYEARHDWLTPPAGLKWGDTHGVCQDSQGRIYIGHTVHPDSERADAIAVFDPEGKFITSWGAAFRGGAHGLDVRREGADEFLYHCDIHRRLVVKTSLDGEVLWEKGFPKESGKYEKAEQYCPTNVAFAPNGDFYVGDGYGSAYIHQYTLKGEYVRTIGEPGAGPGQLNCPHGLWVDERGGGARLVVADRGNRRLQTFSLDGKHLGFVTEGMRMPCHFKIRGELMLIPDLESVVTLVDRENKVVAHLGDGHPSQLRGAAREQFLPGKFIHPHSATFLATGDILVVEWVPIGRVTLLKRA
ncbi:MAG: hypothetical protein AMXMBFR22_28760 [Phycisphaerae bacterium]